jgi:predicted Zn-dependent protease
MALEGCAASPVSGERILVGLDEAGEIAIDRKQSAHQFSRDLGSYQDPEVQRYLKSVALRVQQGVHRPAMPYNYRVVNANHVNAYTFPGGAMGITRGIMVEMRDESELAGLLGHELGHVNARHSAQRQGQALLASVALAAVAVAASRNDAKWAPLVEIGAVVGASALLASYSRENEREADALGQQYMVQAGYPAEGMVRLHQMLVKEEGRDPGLLAALFASHPMSRERRDAAQESASKRYAASRNQPAGRERFLDSTAPLRKIKPTIEACQKGEVLMSRKKAGEAEIHFGEALRASPLDYPALLRMSQCLQAQGRQRDALDYAQRARQAYPAEAQAMKQLASLHMGSRRYEAALGELLAFDQVLPGDPGIVFLQAVNHESLGSRDAAAGAYRSFLREAQVGDAADYARSRLRAWGL